MKERSDRLNLWDSQTDNKEENNLQGYPIYPGSEDEENNYYSLRGDDHIDLEEDLGEYNIQ